MTVAGIASTKLAIIPAKANREKIDFAMGWIALKREEFTL